MKSEWRPIEEAPKDGTLVVLSGFQGIFCGKWIPPEGGEDGFWGYPVDGMWWVIEPDRFHLIPELPHD